MGLCGLAVNRTKVLNLHGRAELLKCRYYHFDFDTISSRATSEYMRIAYAAQYISTRGNGLSLEILLFISATNASRSPGARLFLPKDHRLLFTEFHEERLVGDDSWGYDTPLLDSRNLARFDLWLATTSRVCPNTTI